MLSCLLNKGAYEYLKSTRDKEVGKILLFIMFIRMYSFYKNLCKFLSLLGETHWRKLRKIGALSRYGCKNQFDFLMMNAF